jgi:hypothetical protein
MKRSIIRSWLVVCLIGMGSHCGYGGEWVELTFDNLPNDDPAICAKEGNEVVTARAKLAGDRGPKHCGYIELRWVVLTNGVEMLSEDWAEVCDNPSIGVDDPEIEFTFPRIRADEYHIRVTASYVQMTRADHDAPGSTCTDCTGSGLEGEVFTEDSLAVVRLGQITACPYVGVGNWAELQVHVDPPSRAILWKVDGQTLDFNMNSTSWQAPDENGLHSVTACDLELTEVDPIL